MKAVCAWAALYGLLGLLGASACAAEELAQEGKGIVLTPKYFEPSSGAERGGIGFSYKLDKTIATPVARQELSPQSFHTLNVDFKAEGNVAFNRDINPSDFLKTGLDANYVYSYSGVVQQGGPGSGCDPTNPDTVKACEEEAKRSTTGDAVALFAGLIASLESDQKFEKRNETFGAHLTTVYRPAPGSFVNQANPLDWLFRLTRGFTSHPLGFAPSPDAFPKLRLAVERVKPSKDKDREAILGNTEDYNRANMEIAMSTPAGKVQGKAVKFEWSWRYFKEMSAQPAIEAAGLDQYRYSAASLSLDSGWQITYSTGKLPLGREKDAVWELGYKVKFD